MNAMGDVRPSHLLDRGLRTACGLDAHTGVVVDERAHGIRGYEGDPLHTMASIEEEQEDPLMLL